MSYDKEFLERLKIYIETAEITMDSTGEGKGFNLEQLIKNNLMPAVYGEVLERLVTVTATEHKCPNCGNPLRDCYTYTDTGGSHVVCSWCQSTWPKKSFAALLVELEKQDGKG